MVYPIIVTHIVPVPLKSLNYLQEAEDFIRLLNFNKRIREYGIELALPTSFSESPSTALSDVRRRHINIILGFFGPDNARRVLCMVSM